MEGHSSDDTYDIVATFAPGCSHLIQSFSCTCPDYAAPCKHVGALIMEFCEEPHRFRQSAPLLPQLRKFDKETLLNIIDRATTQDRACYVAINKQVIFASAKKLLHMNEYAENDEQESEACDSYACEEAGADEQVTTIPAAPAELLSDGRSVDNPIDIE